jgi:microcystin-dependent protein
MAYQIIKSDGTLLLELADGFTDSATSSITFIGKNVSKFGEIQNDNFLHLLENFANGTEPNNKLRGQLWFNTSTSTNALKVYNGDRWKSLATLSYEPVSAYADTKGDLWYDSYNKQLFINTGTGFTLIAPDNAPGFNTTRFVSATLLDTDDVGHPVIECLVDGEIVYIISGDDFVTSSTNVISGIDHIHRGITVKNGETFTDDDLTPQVTLTGVSKFSVNATKLRNDTGDAYLYSSIESLPSTIVQRDDQGNVYAIKLTASELAGGGLDNTGIISGVWSVADNISPVTDGGADLGTNSLRWDHVYAQTLDATSLNADISNFGQLKDSNLRYIDRFDNDVTLLADSEFRLPTQHAVKYYVDQLFGFVQGEISGLPTSSVTTSSNTLVKRDASGSIYANIATTNGLKLSGSTPSINNFDIDPTLAADSDSRLATQKAIKKYIDDKVALEISLRIAGDDNLQSQITGLQSVPAGTVFYTAGTSVPTGYLAASGQAVSRTTYAALYTAIGTRYGVGDNSTTFNLPDLRGEFVRGWDNGRGVDTGRTLGTAQTGTVATHSHDFYDIYAMEGDVAGNYSIVNGVPTKAASGSAGAANSGFKDVDGSYAQKYFYMNNGTDGDNDGQAWAVKNKTLQAGGGLGAETRPRNIALQAIIKF